MAAARNFKCTFTVTFGEQAENHAGMQKIGAMADDGFAVAELEAAQKRFEALGCKCELVALNAALPKDVEGAAEAAVLVIRNGASHVLGPLGKGADDLYDEHDMLGKDTKAKMRGRVVNKLARHNLCFSEVAQAADFESGKGTVVPFDAVPLTNKIRAEIAELVGEKARDLQAEGNYYYDLSICGIGFHGDSERKRVVAVRVGSAMPLHYQWFQQSRPVGDRIKLVLGHGDMYVMSDKAVGYDWKKKLIPTLRHAAGCKKFLTIKEEKPKKTAKAKKGKESSSEEEDD